MPFDAAIGLVDDTLADLDRTKPLSVASIKRIVRAVKVSGLLAMDHVWSMSQVGPLDVCPHFAPRGAVDTFLGTTNRSSCPCRLASNSHEFLEELNNLHRIILFWRAIDPAHGMLPAHDATFTAMLGDEPRAHR
jgi:hypothetical protein